MNATLEQFVVDRLEVTNMTINETDYIEYNKRPETYFVPVVFALIFIVGILGNGTLVVVFLRHRAMRNVPNTYILSLALADLLVILSSVPFTSTVYTVESWPFGSPVCIISESAKDVSIGVSVFTLTALSADRFFAIVDPLRKLHATGGGRHATRMTITTAVMIWIVAVGCAVPTFLGTYVKKVQIHETKHIMVCYPFPEAWGEWYPKFIVSLRFLVYYSIPLLVIGIFYALMARHLVLSARNVPGEMQGAQRQIRARKKVAVTVLAFVGVFAVCFLPHHVFMLWFYYSPTRDMDYNAFWHFFRILGFCFSYMNSCVNPVALYCVSGAFRKHFNRYLLCRGRGKKRVRSNIGLGPHGTSMSLTASRRYQSQSIRRIPMSTVRRTPQETSVTILGNGTPTNGEGYVSSRM